MTAMNRWQALCRVKLTQFLLGICILAIPSFANATTYFYTPHDFGPDIRGQVWNIFSANGSNMYDFAVGNVGGYEHVTFKIYKYPGFYCSTSCRVHAVFKHDPTTGFQSSDLVYVAQASWEFPENYPDGDITDVDYQWDSSGYTVSTLDENTLATSSTSILITPTTDMVDSFGNGYEWNYPYFNIYTGAQDDNAFASNFSSSVFHASPTGTDGGGSYMMQTTPHYVVGATSTRPTHLVSSDIDHDSTFYSGQVYKIFGDISVTAGHTLTVQPGAIIKFDTAASSSLTIYGTLDAEGADEHLAVYNHIYSTSLKDDLIGGDTNGDGASTAPAAGDWSGITVNPGGTATIIFATVRYGGQGSSTPMIYNNGGTLNISSTTIAYSANYGISNASGSSTLQIADIGFNGTGIYLSGGSIGVASSTIHNNYLYGAYNATVATSGMMAVNNYWPAPGSATTTGPHNSWKNPAGTGDEVSDFIEFDPWVGKNGTVSSSTPHYIEDVYGCAPYVNTCASVKNRHLFVDGSTTAFTTEFSAAVSTWQAMGNNANLDIESTTTTSDVIVEDITRPDFSWKGQWFPAGLYANHIQMNTPQLSVSSSQEIQNTIEHEMGHSLGLDHSYSGNVMYLNQSGRTVLGPQDIADFNYIWNP